MTRKSKFAISTLFAAGVAPLAAQADDTKIDRFQNNSLLDDLGKMVSNLDASHSFTLAQHQSHGSHGSHGSHESHQSSSYRVPPQEGVAKMAPAAITSRNEMSTPPNSVLPSSPAITRKLKVLPGNSGRFRKLITQVQLGLLAKGYEVGTVNGEVHARTVAALYRYQSDRGFVPSGKVTNEVLSSLGIVAQ